MKRILLVEDDPSLGFVIQDNLSLKGYDVVLCADGETAEQKFLSGAAFDLCILDVMLPKKDGFSLARSIKRKDDQVPIIFLTAKSMVEDKLTGFHAGADDYVVKPFSLEELFCRIEVCLRRSTVVQHANGAFLLGQVEFDYNRLTLKVNGLEKTLTQKEAEVLRLLYHCRNRILKREEILKQIWGDDDYFMGRSMDVFISKLRKYLREDPSVQIVNYHGIGFRLELTQ